jgi:hypothetical protein
LPEDLEPESEDELEELVDDDEPPKEEPPKDEWSNCDDIPEKKRPRSVESKLDSDT